MQRLVVLGAAESGVGTALLAKQKGYEVFVSDSGTIKSHYRDLLTQAGVAFEEGGHTPAQVLAANEVVKSPGIPDAAPLVQQLRAQGTPIVSEIEFAARYTSARMLCVTGSNGKTTTTLLLHHILCASGLDAGLAGNVGSSLALQVATNPRPMYAIELSSFQLDGMFRFRADVAVLMNITPDHLDRYGFQMSRYAESKMRIGQNQTETDSFIYWQEDEWIPSLLSSHVTGRRLPFSDSFVRDGVLGFKAPVPFSMPVEEIPLLGMHNLRNVMAAAMAALAAGAAPEAVRNAIATFSPVEHRQEPAGEADGVLYINDSKATNVDACRCALQAMTRPVVLILGGLDKGNDYGLIMDLVREKCRALVFLGVDNTKLFAAFAPLGLPMEETRSMEACVAACRRLARPGDCVLLSPCCASFDLFTGMSDRGRQFKQQVSTLRK